MILITGQGVISALGVNVNENWAHLQREKSAIKKGIQSFSSPYLVGQIELSNEELKQLAQVDGDYSRTALLGMIAARESFASHEIHPEIRTGFISGTSVGGMDLTEGEYKNYLTENETDRLETYKQHSSGIAAYQIAQLLGATDFVNTISTACSSAANAIMLGARLIESNQLDRVIVGATDALSLFTISGFRSLMIYDTEWCAPFDERRKGLNLGEGAGFIVLESEKSQKITQSKVLGLLSGWCNASDAFHQTASSPDGQGAVLSMQGALKRANLKPEQIDYVNAHGTATPNNDLSESHALKQIFKEIPPFSSTKAYTGHTLAASGGIEAVFSLLAIEHQCLLPNLNFQNPIEETGLMPVQKLVYEQNIKHVLSNSFGFGGNNSSIIISKY